MIRDRGNIKWAGMMLSEHVTEMRKWMAEEDDVEQPILNEWELQLIQEELELAYKGERETLVKTWINGRIIQHQGIIHSLDVSGMWIELEDPFGSERIVVADIVSIQSVNI